MIAAERKVGFRGCKGCRWLVKLVGTFPKYTACVPVCRYVYRSLLYVWRPNEAPKKIHLRQTEKIPTGKKDRKQLNIENKKEKIKKKKK